MAELMRNRRSGLSEPAQLADSSSGDGEFEIDIVELMYRLLEKMHLIVIAAVIGAILMGVYTFRIVTPIYQATSKLYIGNNKDTVVDLTSLNLGSKLASDYIEVFSNWELHDAVKRDLGLNYTLTEMRRMVSVRNPSDTRVLYITCSSSSPEEAKSLAETYAQKAIEVIPVWMGTEAPKLFETPQVPAKPSSPNNVRNILIGIIAGALLAALVIIIQFITDDRIRTTESIEKHLHIPSLGMMPLQAHGEAEDYGVPLADGHHHSHGKSSKKKGGTGK